MKRMIDIKCVACPYVAIDQWLAAGEYPACPTCQAATERLWQSTGTIIGDEIDISTPHIDGKERHFTSRAEFKRALKEAGLVQIVEHKPYTKDSDKSPHTTRWF